MSKDILDEIIAHKRIEIAAQEQNVPISFLEDLLEKNDDMAKVHSMKASLAASATGIIAEFKRRSPSKDWINRDADAKVIPASYQQAGASALSILTDEHFFGGSLRDIRAARPTVSLPHHRPQGQTGIHGPRHGTPASGCPRRLQSGPDGAGRAGLRTQRCPALRAVPAGPPLRRPCRRDGPHPAPQSGPQGPPHRAGDAGARPQPGGCPAPAAPKPPINVPPPCLELLELLSRFSWRVTVCPHLRHL